MFSSKERNTFSIAIPEHFTESKQLMFQQWNNGSSQKNWEIQNTAPFLNLFLINLQTYSP